MTENNKNYCMGCMKEIPQGTQVCPHCYYNNETVQHHPSMPKGVRIAERYLVGRAIAMANDSITYIGLDEQTEEIVSLHEFYPVKVVDRGADGITVNVRLGYEDVFGGAVQSFIAMWKGIGSVRGEISLPIVRNIFDFNGTVYAVCKYTDSITLKSYFEEIKKPLPWQKAQSAFKSVFSALEKLHGAGVIHGGISPSSVHVGSDGKLHLTAFSIPECRSNNEYLASAPVNGFSALELYSEERVAETASDVYSLMALMYYCVTGSVPPKATDRAVKDEMVIPSSVASTLPKKAVNAFIKGLAVKMENRVRSVTELQSLIYSSASAVQPKTVQNKNSTAAPVKAKQNKPAEKKTTSKKAKSTKKNNSLVTLAVGTFTAVVVVCMLIFSVLYATVLYKNYDVPVLNKMFASFDFLPLNSEAQNVDATQPQDVTQVDLPENRYVTVPDFTVHTYDSISTNTVFNNNFDIKYSFEYNDKIAKNAVISQDLVKGESVLAGTTVNLLISRGAEQIELPEVIGLKFSDAEEELKEKGFKVKKVVLDNDGTHESDIVEMTDKVAGLEFDLGTEIVLSVWGEFEEETTTKKSDKKESKKSDKNK
ncbi:MAG: PASTA domain-containing protein, partial [Clostridia bacterium]|nr:PASTA domain-containing protein [Clostridia bacterium]